jgi:hypothetical protein
MWIWGALGVCMFGWLTKGVLEFVWQNQEIRFLFWPIAWLGAGFVIGGGWILDSILYEQYTLRKRQAARKGEKK